MTDSSFPDADSTDLERRLAGLSPAPASDPSLRDRLLFEAGAQAGRRQGRLQVGGLALVVIVGLGGWGLDQYESRMRLSTALAAQLSLNHHLLLAQEPPEPPAPSLPPIEPPDPSSVLALTREFTRDDLARIDPAPSPMSGDTLPGRPGPILTPRSRPGAVDPLTL